MKSPTPSADDDAASGSAVPCSRYVVFIATAAGGFVADLWTKSWIFGKLWPPVVGVPQFIWIWEGHVGFQISWNEGALFGLGQGMVPVFVVLSLIAAVGIVCWLFVWREATSWWLTIALAAVMGGIFGNLYDRLGLHQEVWPPNFARAGERIYAVRDWILVQWDAAHRWPNFNIADSLLVCGAIMLVIHAFFFTHPPREETAAKPDQRKAPA
jgi:signal peptidase II